jgi:hypothetical protein
MDGAAQGRPRRVWRARVSNGYRVENPLVSPFPALLAAVAPTRPLLLPCERPIPEHPAPLSPFGCRPSWIPFTKSGDRRASGRSFVLARGALSSVPSRLGRVVASPCGRRLRPGSPVRRVLGLAHVEEVAQRVAEEVDREDCDHDEQAPEHAEPPGARDEAPGIGQLPCLVGNDAPFRSAAEGRHHRRSCRPMRLLLTSLGVSHPGRG